MLKSGTVIQNRYRIVNPIGKGGFGAVYEAVHEQLGTTVALKQMIVGGENLDKAFQREAMLLAHLNHPSLPRVTDYFSDGDEKFLVMDFVGGPDLDEMIKKRGKPFPLNDVLHWADQFLDALEYLHLHQPPIIHRDIKPQNIKLTPRGQIILLDFGLAKGLILKAQGSEQQARETSLSIAGYTPAYAPLEQIEGTGTDPRSDLYSLAATLYTLLTGIVPPSALSRAAAMLKKEADPLQPVHTLNAQVPAAVNDVLMKALTLTADERLSSAAMMRTMLLAARQETSYHTETFVDPPFDPLTYQLEQPYQVAEANVDELVDSDALTIPADLHESEYSAIPTRQLSAASAAEASAETIVSPTTTAQVQVAIPVTRAEPPTEATLPRKQKRGCVHWFLVGPVRFVASLIVPLVPVLVFAALYFSFLWMQSVELNRFLIGAIALVIGVLGVWGLFYVADGVVSLLPRRVRELVRPVAFVGPALIVLLVYLVYPTFYTLATSFYGPDSQELVHLNNYLFAFTDETMRIALRNTLMWMAIVTSVTVLLGLIIAVMVERIGRWEPVAKSLIFMPMAISAVSASVIWQFMYYATPGDEVQTGLVNAIITAMGGQPVDFMINLSINTFALMLIMIWTLTGFCMVILSAAVKSIPAELLESARLDGAGEGQIFFNVIIPSIRGTIITVATTVLIMVLKVFDIVYVITNGRFETDVVASRMFDEMFNTDNYGHASALVMLLVVATIPVMLFTIHNLRRREDVRP